MGSYFSSSPAKDIGSFSIDPSGNITSSSSKANSKQYSSEQTKEKSQQAPATLIDEQQSYILPLASSLPPPIVLDQFTTMAPTKHSDELNLNEAKEVVSRLKAKYKPDSREMAGKQRSVFEEVERNLVQCYVTNKSQPANCSKLYNEYKGYVVSCFGAMSIDLGSEWMKVGLVAPSVPMDIVLNAQSQRKTPMAIAFSNGERFIGDTALDVASKYPEKTYTHFLDLVGKTIDHESVKHYQQRFPYANITNHEPNSTSILLNHPEGLNFTPLELIAMMIQHAHDQVTNRLNSNEPSHDVVITVPPFFNAIERRVIEDAAKLVGLNVLRLTNVNSAFALSYGIFRHKDYLQESKENTTSILFFDQGASQTSATLADYHLVEQFDETTGLSKNESLPTVTIRAQVYDRYLGGFDMQLKLRDHLVRAFSKMTKIDETRIFKRGRSSAKLLKESGRVKKILSANTGHLVRVENVIDDQDLKQPITRQEFEELNQEYLGDRVKSLLDKLFEMPNVSRDDPLESVIIVGGNTRTPKIQQVLLDYFKLDALGKSINADEGAALAALYQAASLGRGFRVKKFVLEEFGEERKRFDGAAAATQQPPTADTTAAPSIEVLAVDKTITKDPNSIYSESELERVGRKLSHLREQDFMRLQRLSLRNSLESLLSEAREKLSDGDEQLKDKKEEIQTIIHETYSWLEDGSEQETGNVTILAEKYNSIHELIHPKPPPLPPTLDFDPTQVDLSSVLKNGTLNILDALNNLSNPFAQHTNESDSTPENGTRSTPSPAEQQNEPTPSSTQTPPGDGVKPPGAPPHSEL